MISLVVAMDNNGLIGKDNGLPWKLKGELSWFKTITMGKPVVMGRKTFDSLGGVPLPHRLNIVMTHDREFTSPGYIQTSNIDTIRSLAEDQEIMVIGGAQIYEAFLPYAGRIYRTRIDNTYEGDTHFPPMDDSWTVLSRWKQMSDDQPYYIEVLVPQ